MTLYRPGHPARERAIDDAYRELNDLQATEAQPLFTFLGDEIVFGRLPLRELKAWDWGQRLALAGIQRLEFSDAVSREEFEQFLDEVLARLTLSAIDTTEARQMRRSSIRFGAVGVRGGDEQSGAAIPTATITYSLSEEADTVRWVQEEVQARGTLPRFGAGLDEPASRGGRPPHPARRGRPGSRRGGRVRAPHHAERGRLSHIPVPARLPRREQARPRVRRVRRAPHQPALPRSVAAVEDLVVHRGSGRHGVRSGAGGCVRADDAAIRAAGGGAD